MDNKFIEFEDGGLFKLIKYPDHVLITIQAKHFGKEFKITSTSIQLTNDEVKDVIEWLQESTKE